MKRITRIVTAAAVALSFGIIGFGDSIGAQEMDHGRRTATEINMTRSHNMT